MRGVGSVRRSLRVAEESRAAERALRLVGWKTLHCIGDSHLEPLNVIRRCRTFTRTRLRVQSIGGATASGLANPNSLTEARPKFLAVTSRLHPGMTMLSCLGEVDAGFLVFAAAERKGTDPRAEALVSLGRYFDFLEVEAIQRGARVIVVGVIPPLIEDYGTWAGLRGQRRDVSATWAERAEMTSFYNQKLKQWCQRTGSDWMDLASVVSDGQTGRVNPDWVNSNHEDHHLAPDRHAQLFVRELEKRGYR